MKCLKKRVWSIWKWAVLFHHASRNNLPLFLCILFVVQSFVIYRTDFYADYYKWFDYFDTLIYCVITYDILKQYYQYLVHQKTFKYNETNTVCCVTLYLLVLLNLIQYAFGFNDYINIYKSIIFSGAIAIILTYIKE